MAYLLGFLFADGSVVNTKRGGWYLDVQISDREVLEFLKKELCADQVISERKAISGHLFRLQIGSKDICASLAALGFLKNKSFRMRIPKVPAKYRNSFIRGYFDGDGNVWSGVTHKERKKTSTGLLVAFTSVSKEFLTDLLYLLHLQGVSGGSLFKANRKEAYRLNLGKRDALKLYKLMYNDGAQFCLGRKRSVFIEYLRL